MKVTGFSHASVNAHGVLEETLKFYREFLGLETLPRPSPLAERVPGAWYRTGPAEVHVIGTPHDGRPGHPAGPHYALLVEDLDLALHEIEAAGLPHIKVGEGKTRQVWISDPAGNTIELQQDHVSGVSAS